MLQTLLGLYVQGLVLTIMLVVVLSFCWFIRRAWKELDKTVQERQQFLYDLLVINVVTIPILSFGVVGILVMMKG